jgi:hypothetical protein
MEITTPVTARVDDNCSVKVFESAFLIGRIELNIGMRKPIAKAWRQAVKEGHNIGENPIYSVNKLS